MDYKRWVEDVVVDEGERLGNVMVVADLLERYQGVVVVMTVVLIWLLYVNVFTMKMGYMCGLSFYGSFIC